MPHSCTKGGEVSPPFKPNIVLEPGDYDYDDGRVAGFITIFERAGDLHLTIYEWSSRYLGQGHTTAALRWFRTRCAHITAYGVGTIDISHGDEEPDISVAYWQHMQAKGLVDRLIDDDHREIPVPALAHSA